MSEYVVNQRWWLLTGSRYEITYIAACTHDSNEISTAIPTFSRFSNSVEVHVSQLVDMIESKFQRHLPYFRGWPTQWHKGEFCRM